MITELTKEQAARMPEFVDKWLNVGLCTDRIDRQLAKRVADYYYSNIAKKEPVPVVIMDSPYSAWLAVCLLSVRSQVRSQFESQVWSQVESQVGSQVRAQVRSQVESQVWSQVWSQVASQVWSQVESQVWSQVASQVWSQVESQVGSQVRAQVRSQVRSQVVSQVRSQVESQVGNFIWPYLDGHLWASWFSFYDFLFSIGVSLSGITQKHYDWFKNTTELGLIYPLPDVCIISERPAAIRMKNGRLHSEDSPSLEYADGFFVYSLNGVRMKQEYVLTPASKLTPDAVLKEGNVDMRRELLRKVGVLRMVSYGREIESWNGYKLVDMSPVLGLAYAPYLLMKNPSVEDTWHLEGVEPECRTIEQALHRHKPEKMREIPVDDKIGEDWYQQGDVMIWPEGAIALKRYPVVLS